MPWDVSSTTNLLNTMKKEEIKTKSWTHLATSQRLPILRAILKGEGIVKEKSSDKVTWGVGTRKLDDVVFNQQYRGAARRSEPLPSLQLSYSIPLQEAKAETYDVNELEAHKNAGYQQFGDYLGEQEDQHNEGIATDQEQKLTYVPANSSDPVPFGLMWYLQPNRASNGTIEAAAEGGFVGDRMMYADGTTTTTRCGQDLSTEAAKKLRNYAHSIDNEITLDTVQAFRRAMLYTSFQMLSFASSRFSTGNLKNAENADRNLRLSTSTRLYCNGADFLALAAFVDAVSPDDTGGDAVKFAEPKFAGLQREWLPTLDDQSELYLDGEGTVYPYSPMYIVNWSKWTMDMIGNFWKKTAWVPNPDNPAFSVMRQARAQYNLRPTNDIRSAGAVFYRLTA